MKPHRGTLILVLGILGIIFNGCLIPGLLAWILGRSDLKRMKAGTMDQSGEGMTKAGFVCGIIGTCLWIIGAIVAVFLSMAMVAAAQVQQNAELDATLSQINTLENACTSYKLQVGRFPNTLDDLYTQPAGLSPRQWRGPYLNDPVPMDPWGNEYVYSPDEANNRVFISSAGPDGQQGSPDDIPEPNTQ